MGNDNGILPNDDGIVYIRNKVQKIDMQRLKSANGGSKPFFRALVYSTNICSDDLEIFDLGCVHILVFPQGSIREEPEVPEPRRRRRNMADFDKQNEELQRLFDAQ